MNQNIDETVQKKTAKKSEGKKCFFLITKIEQCDKMKGGKYKYSKPHFLI